MMLLDSPFVKDRRSRDPHTTTTTVTRAGLGVLIVLKYFRSVALYYTFFLFQFFPVTLFVFLALGISSTFFLWVHKPWQKSLQSNHWVLAVGHGIVILLNFIFWCQALKYFGPIRTIICSDYGDIAWIAIISSICCGGGINSKRVGFGALLLLMAYLLLFFFGPSPSSASPISSADIFPSFADVYVGNNINNSNSNDSSNSNNNHNNNNNNVLGGFCLLLGIFLTILRKKMAKQFQSKFRSSGRPKDTGGKLLQSMGIFCATVIVSPFGLYQLLTNPSLTGLPVFWTFLKILGIVFFLIVIDYYIESFGRINLDQSTHIRTSILSCFLSVLFCDWWWGGGTGNALLGVSIVAVVLVLVGFSNLASDSSSSSSPPNILPVFVSDEFSGGSSSSCCCCCSLMWVVVLRKILKQIWMGSDSRKIFIFLIINLSFMIIELSYGWRTNSLGLISDSFHMLFDSMALAIGLYASVLKNWSANHIFTYGYGRVQVLSGFVNSVFLCFISISIFVESIERLYEPPKIESERLLLVAIVGFFVNMIGLFAFHDHSGHAHGHGHGQGGHHPHSHGHTNGLNQSYLHDKKSIDNYTQNHHSHHDDHHHHECDLEHGHEEVEDDNLYGVWLHILADALGSVGVIVSSLLVWLCDWHRADPLCSLMIAVLIALSVLPLLKHTSSVLLQRTPPNIEQAFPIILRKLQEIPGVRDWSEPHIWALTSGQVVGTVTLHVDDDANEQKILSAAIAVFESYDVSRITVQINKQLINNNNHNSTPPPPVTTPVVISSFPSPLFNTSGGTASQFPPENMFHYQFDHHEQQHHHHHNENNTDNPHN